MKKKANSCKLEEVLLIYMPWLFRDTAPLGINCIKSALTANSIPCSVRYEQLAIQKKLAAWRSVVYRLNFKYPNIENAVYTHLLFPEEMPRIKQQIKDNLPARDFKLFSEWLPEGIKAAQNIENDFLSFLDRKAENLLLIGMSVNYTQLLPSVYRSQNIRKYYPSIPIVWGGGFSLPRRSAAYLEKFPFIDSVVYGEGERSFLNLVQSYKKNKGMPLNIKGTMNRKYFNPPDSLVDLDALPFPDLQDYYDLSDAPAGKQPVLTIEACQLIQTTDDEI